MRGPIEREALLIRFLTSPKIAFTLITAIGIVVVFRHALGIGADSVFLTWVLVVLLLLASVSMLASMYDRSRLLLRSPSTGLPAAEEAEHIALTFPLPVHETRQTLEGALSGLGWKAHPARSDTLVRARGSAGPWGSILFHGGLVLVFVGAILSALASFHAMFALTTGETTTLTAGHLRLSDANPFSRSAKLGGIQVSLLEFDRAYRSGPSATPSSLLLVQRDGVRTQDRVHVNHPLDAGDVRFHQGDLWGYSTGLYITRGPDSIVFSGFLRIATDLSETAVRFRDSVRLTDGSVLHVSFFPDARKSSRGIENLSFEARNPLLLGTVRTADGDTVRFEVAAEAEQVVGPYTVAFPMLRFWSQFSVGTDPGIPFLGAGVLACVLGLLLRMLFSYSRLYLTIAAAPDGAIVTLSGVGEKNTGTLAERIGEAAVSITGLLGSHAAANGTQIDDPH